MSVETIADAKAKIQEWMNQRGYFASEINSDGFNFHLIGKNEGGIGFSILQPKAFERIILVLTQVDVDPLHYKSLSSMRPKDRDEFLWDMWRELIFAPVAFNYDSTFNTTGIPKSIQFSKEITFEDLSDSKLREAQDYTVRGVLWAVSIFNREFGKPGAT